MMKTTLSVFVYALLSVIAAAKPEISGIFTVSGATRIVLIESETGVSLGWLTMGGRFGEYRLVSYDQKSESLVVERNGREETIKLKNAKIEEMRIALSGSIRLGVGGEAEAQKIVLLFDRESSFPLGPGATFFLKAKRMSDGNIEYRVRWEIATPDGKVEITKGPRMITAPGEGLSLDMGGYGFELKP